MEKELMSTEKKTIKRLLRHRSSNEYFKDDGWTTNPDEARAFSDIVEVAQTCAQHGLSNVELTLRNDNVDIFCTPLR